MTESGPAGTPGPDAPGDDPLPRPDLDFDALDEPPPTTHRPGRARLVSPLIVLALVASVAGGALWSHRSTGPSPKVTIRGTIILTNAETLSANCVGQGSYRELRAGAPVVLTNQAGDTIGRATLAKGEPDYDDGICSYPFTIAGVPSDQADYFVEVAQLGRILKSRAELVQSGWTYFLALT